MSSYRTGPVRRHKLGMLLLLAWTPWAWGDTLTLSIQPILPPDETREAFQPLADFIAETIDRPIEINTSHNFFTYWQNMRRGDGFDLVLDAAHFTDYRIRELGFNVLVKQPDTVSYTLVSREGLLALDPDELVGRPVATTPAPSMGSLLMSELYPSPLQQPALVEVHDTIEALEKTARGEVDGAFVPTLLVQNYPMLNVISVTDSVPHIALSASSDIDAEDRRRIREALLDASETERGQAMLEAINLPPFEPANDSIYRGYSRLMEGTWGYDNQARSSAR